MPWYEALVLGIVQGLTEFIPVSSSGHLVVFPYIFNWENQPLVFDLVLHLGTVTALLFYFKKDILNIVLSILGSFGIFGEKEYPKTIPGTNLSGLNFAIYLFLGSLPAAILGYFLDNFIEDVFRGVFTVSILLFIGSILMFFAEMRYRRMESFKEPNIKRSIVIGFFQSLALFPGMSRSGSTLSGGMLMGLSREYAARFSFLMSMPIIAGAAVLKLITSSSSEISALGTSSILLGYFSSFIVGYFAISFLLKFLKNNSLYVFIMYRIVLSVILLIFHFLAF